MPKSKAVLQRYSQTNSIGWGILLCTLLIAPCYGENSDPDLLVVRETRWGFDSTIQVNSFVPLSVHLQNAAEIPWTGTMTLSRGVTALGLGINTEMEITLQPNEDRWVQFVPFIVDDLEEWTLRWGPQKNHTFTLTNIQKGPPPTVLVTDPDAVTPLGSVLRTLQEPLFPTTVVATEALRGVIFNDAPFWQGARAQAFTEWLRRGGRVYILQNDKGVFPTFNKPLEYLNSEGLNSSIGYGTVKKLALKASDISLSIARREIFNNDRPKTPNKNRVGQMNYEFTTSWNRYQELFRELRPVTAFQRRWSIIYLTALAYLAVLFYCYRIGRRNDQVRWFYSAFITSVVLFSILFISLGQLGASVQNRIRTTSLVHHLHDHVYEVTDWSTAANVNAGEYKIEFDGTGHCLSTCSDMERVNGKIQFGRTSSLVLDMPPATIRTFMQKRRVIRDTLRPQFARFQTDTSGLEECSVNIKDCFEGRILNSFVVHRTQIYPLEHKNNLLSLIRKGTLDRPKQASLHTELSRMVNWQYTHKDSFFRLHNEYNDEESSISQHYETMLKSLVGNSYGLTKSIDANKLSLPPNIVRLFVYTTLPKDLASTSLDFPDKDGTAMFVFDLKTSQ